MVDAAPVAIPAVKGESRRPDEELPDEATSRHIRKMCGQILYKAQERVDLLWWRKTMSKPSINDLTRCRRVAIYLKATRGYEAILVPQQDADGLLHVAVDSGWVKPRSAVDVGDRHILLRCDDQRILAHTRLGVFVIG